MFVSFCLFWSPFVSCCLLWSLVVSCSTRWPQIPWEVCSQRFLGRFARNDSLGGLLPMIPWEVCSQRFLGRFAPWEVCSLSGLLPTTDRQTDRRATIDERHFATHEVCGAFMCAKPCSTFSHLPHTKCHHKMWCQHRTFEPPPESLHV